MYPAATAGSRQLLAKTLHSKTTAAKDRNCNNKVYPNKEWNGSCKHCCNQEVELLQQLPFAETPILEDERHILASCPAYHHLRLQLNDHIKSTLVAWDERITSLFEESSMTEFGLYVHKIFRERFPKRKTRTTQSTLTRTGPDG